MNQKSFSLLISIVIIFACIQPVFAENNLDLDIVKPSQLLERKSTWPDWRIPTFLKRPNLKEDLIYPEWFEGEWDVNSKIEVGKNKESIFHSAKFIRNSFVTEYGFHVTLLLSVRYSFVTF